MKHLFFLFVFFTMVGVNANAQAISYDAKSIGSFQDGAGVAMTISGNSLSVVGATITGMTRKTADDFTGVWSSAKSKNVRVRFHFNRDPQGQASSVDVIDDATGKPISSYTRKTPGSPMKK